MGKHKSYVDLRGRDISAAELDAEERSLLSRLQRRARSHPSWIEFGNYWMREVAAFYDARGVARADARRSAVFRIAQDLCSRLGIAEGRVRAPDPNDYRDELEYLVLQFPTRAAFCKATGISQAMLSHVLAGRKDLSLETLSKALGRIGYRMSFAPAARTRRTG